MTAQVQLAGNGFGGLVQGNYGNYQAAADGTFTVDTRDAPSMLTLGMAYVKQVNTSYTTPAAPAAAGVGAIVASAALSDGTLSIAASPDVMRPVAVEVNPGTAAITAGNLAVTYEGNDGQTLTENVSLICKASAPFTNLLSRGVVTVSSAIITALAGGHSPFVRLNTTAAISAPIDPGAQDVAFTREYDDGATIAVGAASVALGSISPTTAPNGTHTYSFVYSYIAPTS